MKQTAMYEISKKTTETEILIRVDNYKLTMEDFPLSMYENLVEDIKAFDEDDQLKTLTIVISGNNQRMFLVSRKVTELESEPYNYMSMLAGGGICYSTIAMNESPRRLLRVRELSTGTTAINFMADVSVYIKSRGE